ncbi:MAG: tryptophan 7-halogenase [Planctomycetaceae bacterium]
MHFQADMLILGSGFGGSLLGMILAKSGWHVVIADTARHPRFAIGESSTPLADAALAKIATTYDLPELVPLTRYGSWKRIHPELTCGLKRGFSYFGHSPGRDLTPHTIAGQQLLVSASAGDDVSDTHWLRSDVDAFFAVNARQHGVVLYEGAEYTLHRTSAGWTMEGTTQDGPFQLSCPFVVDATGAAGVVLRTLSIADLSHQLLTSSRSVFAHFSDVRRVGALLAESGIDRSRHPFPCDAAAVHHVLDNGWMWQLPFDDDTVSAGFMFHRQNADIEHGFFPVEPGTPGSSAAAGTPLSVWDAQLQRFPFLRRQFENATVVRPREGLVMTGRLQRLAARAAGPNWAALPFTAGFIDPLHSTGIAHTLFGVRRLADILLTTSIKDIREQRLAEYSADLIREIRHIDRLVEGCYAGLPSFRLWCAWTMLYFAAVTSMEHSSKSKHGSFLMADDVEFRKLLISARRRLQNCVSTGASNADCGQFEAWLREAIAPWNSVGLLDPDSSGMYAGTAAR